MNLADRTGFYTIKPSAGFEDVASSISAVLGIHFSRDETGHFDEYPAFVGSGNGLKLVLLGNPNKEDNLLEEPIDAFELQVTVQNNYRGCDSPHTFDRMIVDRLKQEAGLICSAEGWGT